MKKCDRCLVSLHSRPPESEPERQKEVDQKLRMKKILGSVVSVIAVAGIVVGDKFGLF